MRYSPVNHFTICYFKIDFFCCFVCKCKSNGMFKKSEEKNGCVNCYHDVLFAALCVYSFLFANCERKESKRNGKMGSVQYDYDGPTHRSPAMEKTRILFILPKITPFCQIICKYVLCVRCLFSSNRRWWFLTADKIIIVCAWSVCIQILSKFVAKCSLQRHQGDLTCKQSIFFLLLLLRSV